MHFKMKNLNNKTIRFKSKNKDLKIKIENCKIDQV